MVDRYLSPKFSVNSFTGIRENDVDGQYDGRMDNGLTTTDARVTTVALPAVQ